MKDWIETSAYDIWKTTPPDDTVCICRCSECKEELYLDDICYEIEGEIMCEYCAEQWLECQKMIVTEEMQDE